MFGFGSRKGQGGSLSQVLADWEQRRVSQYLDLMASIAEQVGQEDKRAKYAELSRMAEYDLPVEASDITTITSAIEVLSDEESDASTKREAAKICKKLMKLA